MVIFNIYTQKYPANGKKIIHPADADATQLSSWIRISQLGLLATVSTSPNIAIIEVELRRAGGVNAPVCSRDPVYNFLLYCWAIEVGDKWRHCWKSYQYRSKFT